MNTRISEADVAATRERVKTAIVRDLTPRELADHLLSHQAIDHPTQTLELAFKDLMQAADRRARARLATQDARIGADPRVIIRALVDDYDVKQVSTWVEEMED